MTWSKFNHNPTTGVQWGLTHDYEKNEMGAEKAKHVLKYVTAGLAHHMRTEKHDAYHFHGATPIHDKLYSTMAKHLAKHTPGYEYHRVSNDEDPDAHLLLKKGLSSSKKQEIKDHWDAP
jgi:hypothetical protein